MQDKDEVENKNAPYFHEVIIQQYDKGVIRFLYKKTIADTEYITGFVKESDKSELIKISFLFLDSVRDAA